MINHKPAGFWMRFLANLIDSLLISALGAVIAILINEDNTAQMQQVLSRSPEEMDLFVGMPVSPSSSISGLIYVIIFIIIFTGSKFRGSPGKLICRIEVVNPDMTQIGIGKSIARYFSYILSGLIFMIGFMMVGWNKEKKGLHDIICNTRVVYRK